MATIDLDVSESEIEILQEIELSKDVEAVVDPLPTDDDPLIYRVGKIWINTVTNQRFLCESVAPAATVWRLIPATETINSASTGLIEYGGFGFNASPSLFDLGIVKGYIIDNVTDPNLPVKVLIDDAAVTGLTPQFLATKPVSWVGRGIGGIVQSDVPFTAEELESTLQCGVVVHSGGTVEFFNNRPNFMLNPYQQFVAVMKEIGLFNGSGNVFSAVGGGHQIKKTQGNFVDVLGVNYPNLKSLPTKNLPLLDPITFRYRLADGTELAPTTVINPNILDNLTSTPIAVSNNKFTIKKINVFSSNEVRIQPGQTEYASLSVAKQAIDDESESFVIEPNIDSNSLFRAFLIVQEGTTDLSIVTDAFFKKAPRFKGGGAGAGGTSVSSFQQVYGNSLPVEVITDAVRLGLTMQVGSGSDTDLLYEGKNTAGATTFSVDGNGLITLATAKTLKYVEADVLLTGDATSEWVSRAVSGAPINAAIDILVQSDTGSNTIAGVRAVGSARTRTVQQDTDRAYCLTVQTDASSNIEIFSSSATVDFIYVGHTVFI